MGITFLGNTSDYKTWFFNIDGKTFVANNSSTVSPLKLMFTRGRFYGAFRPEQIIPNVVLVKNHSFDIITGTSEAKGVDYIGIVEWTWDGQKYRSAWKLFEGDVIREAVPEEGDPGIYSYDLYIIPPYVPYNGPTGGAVGGGVVSQRTVEAQQSGGTAPSGGGTTPSGGGTTPSGGGTTTGGGVATGGGTTTGGGVVTGGGTTTPPTPTAVAGTDWVKLGLQIGAAYLLLS